MTKELNSAFENVHPRVKVVFTEIEVEKYEVAIELYTDQGKFFRATSQELEYSYMKDERFPAMVQGSAKAFSEILASAADLDSLLETLSPSELIVESILSNKSLSSVDDFATRLDTIAERKTLLAQEY
ncbi:MAG TPA: hypothetical protein VK622_17265, partial [Puia sp.]|nr:hypothetical protein [Puia sp.]